MFYNLAVQVGRQREQSCPQIPRLRCAERDRSSRSAARGTKWSLPKPTRSLRLPQTCVIVTTRTFSLSV